MKHYARCVCVAAAFAVAAPSHAQQYPTKPVRLVAPAGTPKGMLMKDPPHPGRIVKQEIEELGLTIAATAEALGAHARH